LQFSVEDCLAFDEAKRVFVGHIAIVKIGRIDGRRRQSGFIKPTEYIGVFVCQFRESNAHLLGAARIQQALHNQMLAFGESNLNARFYRYIHAFSYHHILARQIWTQHTLEHNIRPQVVRLEQRIRARNAHNRRTHPEDDAYRPQFTSHFLSQLALNTHYFSSRRLSIRCPITLVYRDFTTIIVLIIF
jgi:hypothetical protein